MAPNPSSNGPSHHTRKKSPPKGYQWRKRKSTASASNNTTPALIERTTTNATLQPDDVLGGVDTGAIESAAIEPGAGVAIIAAGRELACIVCSYPCDCGPVTPLGIVN